MSDNRIRVLLQGGETFDVFMSQSEWNDTQLDLTNVDTNVVQLANFGYIFKDKLIALIDVDELVERTNRNNVERGVQENPRDPRANRNRSEADVEQRGF